jgi:ketosteroid isomerase-like protein
MKTNIKLVSLMVLSVLAFMACKAPEEPDTIDMGQLKVEIQAMEDAFAAAEKAKDADAVVAYYSDDAVGYGNNRKPLSGKAAIRDNIAERLANDTLGHYNVYKVVDLFAEGKIAVEIGSWTEYDASGNEVDNGHYMSYFEKRDGKYQCVRDMSNTTSPAKTDM